jgi:ATP-dependent helicase/nuclease subunit A
VREGFFFAALDAPGGLKIQTIHSFCQSLLQSFPFEAGLDPCFELIEEEAANLLLKKAFQKLSRIFPVVLSSDFDCLTNELSTINSKKSCRVYKIKGGNFIIFKVL